jgi:hypothetical protein
VRQPIGQRSSETQSAGSSSFLVRLWREPQVGGSGPVRVYLRNLQTGEELYLGDPRRVGEVLSREAESVGHDDRNLEEAAPTAKSG